jgi:hypothetical protein
MSCTRLIKNFLQCAISPMVPKTGKSMRFMMVELNRLMNSFFGIKCISPVPSGAHSQKTSGCICGNNAKSMRSRSRNLTCSTFPLRSPTISTRVSHSLSGTAFFVMALRLAVALDIHTFVEDKSVYG